MTYVFDRPTVVTALDLVQHANGVRIIEGFVGNSVDDLVSIGTANSVWFDWGHEQGYPEGGLDTFVFNAQQSQAGLVFRFLIRESRKHDGYAFYRAWPKDAGGRILPATVTW